MFGILILLVYCAAGVVCARALFADRPPILRVWLGLSLGILLLMWLPALAAFLVRFTMTAQAIALGVLALLTAGAVLAQKKRGDPPARSGAEDAKALRLSLLFALPLTALSCYLQVTHTLLPVDGALHTGQSTYGDLCMHLSIATSLRGSALPMDYNILPGTLMGYPFLTDSTATTMLLWGTPLRWAMILPACVMSFLVYWGYVLLAREMCKGRIGCALLAAALLFFNGGLGFLYDFDLSGNDFSKITEIFTGYYKTPANQPEFNLRWSNLIADLLLPQRTFLGGWCILLPSLYLAREAFRRRRITDFLAVGVAGGSLPLIHAHSCAALALYSAGAMGFLLLRDREHRRELVRGGAVYLLTAAALGLPQLLGVTMRQASSGGFLRFHFNWVNLTAAGFVDFYPWFWLKNVGLPLIAIVGAVFDADRRQAADAVGAALIFVTAELVLFQPLDYDNNKLFYIWYLLMLPQASEWLCGLYARLKGIRVRAALACLFVACSVCSGALSVARETVSDYQLFSANDVALAEYIDANTQPDDVFMTGMHHNNPVYALCGRDVVCGPDLFLYFHGLDYGRQAMDVRLFYRDPAGHLDILERYGVSYIVTGPWERSDPGCDEAAFEPLFDRVFRSGSTSLWKVREDTGSAD